MAPPTMTVTFDVDIAAHTDVADLQSELPCDIVMVRLGGPQAQGAAASALMPGSNA